MFGIFKKKTVKTIDPRSLKLNRLSALINKQGVYSALITGMGSPLVVSDCAEAMSIIRELGVDNNQLAMMFNG